MKILCNVFFMVFFFALAACGQARAEMVDIGASFMNGGLSSFYLAIGDYYRVPEREVIIIRERGIPSCEIPVVYYLARRARVAPEVIIGLRLDGRGWFDIALHYGLGPDVFYVPVPAGRCYGPPFGKAYGHYKHHKKGKRVVILDDDDVVNLVNLRFISDYYRVPPERVIELRSSGKDYVIINDEMGRAKHRHPAVKYRQKNNHHKHDKGRDKHQVKGNRHDSKDGHEFAPLGNYSSRQEARVQARGGDRHDGKAKGRGNDKYYEERFSCRRFI